MSFFRLLPAALLVVCLAMAQGSGIRIPGRVVTKTSADVYNVELYEINQHMLVERCHVAPDGAFELQQVSSGMAYEIRVVNRQGDAVYQESVSFANGAGSLELRLRESATAAAVAPGGPVSVHKLQHAVPKKAQKEFKRAEAARLNGEIHQSMLHLERALAIDPEYAEAWNNLGARKLNQGDNAGAEAAFLRAIAIDPQSAVALSNLAYVALMLQRAADAETYSRRALRLDPRANKPRYLLGLALAQQGKEKMEAIQLLEQASGEMPRAHFAVSSLLVESGRIQEAANHLKAYLDSGQTADRDAVKRWLKSMEQALGRR